MPGYSLVDLWVALIDYHKEQVKARHDGRAEKKEGGGGRREEERGGRGVSYSRNTAHSTQHNPHHSINNKKTLPSSPSLSLPPSLSPSSLSQLTHAHTQPPTHSQTYLMLTLALSGFVLSYLPKTGLAAARMEVRALRVAWMPALVMLIVCCSMAS